jgi:hypothetical protein
MDAPAAKTHSDIMASRLRFFGLSRDRAGMNWNSKQLRQQMKTRSHRAYSSNVIEV